MQNLVVTINSVDYTSYMQGFSVIWPCTQAVPTATITLDNTTGIFVNLPLKSAVTIVVNGTYIFNGVTESYPYTLDKSMGHRVAIACKSCYELTTLVEGSLQVVGTNLQVEIFGRYGQSSPYNVLTTTLSSSPSAGAGSFTVTNGSGFVNGMYITVGVGLATSEIQQIYSVIGTLVTIVGTLKNNHVATEVVNGIFDYIPYPSVWAGATLNANLMDVGDVFKGLIHDVQPGQTTGYRGRLGYDVTSRGIATTSFGLNPPTIGGLSNIYELGLYVKGMWYVGPGSVGSTSATSGSGANTTSLAGSGREAFGIDLLKALCQGSIIDSSGNPQFVDWFYDPANNWLTYFKRGSKASGVTFVIGTDMIQANNLPVDITDVKNDLVLWFNAENAYPADQDAWTNYPTSAELQGQWTLSVTSGGGTAATRTTDGTNTFLGYGWANKYTATGSVAGTVLTSNFDLHANGYQQLAPLDSLKNKRWDNNSAFNLNLFRLNVGASDDVTVFLIDANNSSNTVQYDATAQLSASPGTWSPIKIPIPPSGHGSWIVTGSWDFATTTIGTVSLHLALGTFSGANNTFWIDNMYFTDNYYFSPVYNDFGPYIGTINPQTGSPYTSGLGVTYDNNSIAAYGDRIYNWNDYYTSGNSDAAVGVAQNLLLSRRGKHSYGSLMVYNPPLGTIFPGYLIGITDSKDAYVGSTVDSTITSWFVEQIEYDYDMTNGFIGTYTVEPYYASFNGTNSPDTNARDAWSQYRKNPSYQRAYMNTKTRFTTSY